MLKNECQILLQAAVLSSLLPVYKKTELTEGSVYKDGLALRALLSQNALRKPFV